MILRSPRRGRAANAVAAVPELVVAPAGVMEFVRSLPVITSNPEVALPDGALPPGFEVEPSPPAFPPALMSNRAASARPAAPTPATSAFDYPDAMPTRRDRSREAVAVRRSGSPRPATMDAVLPVVREATTASDRGKRSGPCRAIAAATTAATADHGRACDSRNRPPSDARCTGRRWSQTRSSPSRSR